MKLRDFQFFLAASDCFLRATPFGPRGLGYFSAFACVNVCLFALEPPLIAQTGVGANNPRAQATSASGALDSTTPLYRQAVERFGPPSLIRLTDSNARGLESWTPPGVSTLSAVILDWTDKELILIKPDSVDRTLIPNPRVLNLDVSWADEVAVQMGQELAQRKYSECISTGSKLLATKDSGSALPRYQQKIVISSLVEASCGMGRFERAALLYVSLVKSNSPPLLLSKIPIPWTTSSAMVGERAKLQDLARNWMQDSIEGVQLLGAAWLLDSSAREDAIKVLTHLSRNAAEPWIKQYATVQLWRTVAPNQITSETLAQWTRFRDSIAQPLQAGPSYLLADKLAASEHSMRAIEEWMRVITLHPDRPYLCDQAMTAMSPLLDSIGDAETAKVLRQHLESSKSEK